MTRKSVRIAVTLPGLLSRSVEAARKKSRRSLGSVVQNALNGWLRAENHSELERQYAAAYRRKPETRREIASARASALETLSKVEW